MTPSIRAIFLALLCLLASGGNASAAMVLPLGLDRIHGDAKDVFLGECVSNSVELDPQSNRVVTYTSFKILETYKGKLSGRHTIKQIGGSLPEANLNVRVPGVPEFDIGKRYVVFLPQASNLGFSTPIGLHQGAFPVETDETGVDHAGNGRDLGELLEKIPEGKMPSRVADKIREIKNKNVPVRAKERSDMHLDDLKSILRGMGQ